MEKPVIPQGDWPSGAKIQPSGACVKGSMSEGKAGIPHFTPEHSDTTLSLLPQKSVAECGGNTDFVQAQLHKNGVRNTSDNTLDVGCPRLESSREKERTEKQPHGERTSSPRPQERVHTPEFGEDGGTLKSGLDKVQMNLQDVGDPSACTGTTISIQNLIKRAILSELPNETSNVPSPGVSPINNSSEEKAENRGDPLCIASLLEILKQDQHTQETPGTSELIKVLTQTACNPEERGLVSGLFPPQLKNAFCKLLLDGYSAEREQAEALKQTPCAAPEMVEEKPCDCSDLKSKEGNHYTPNPQTVREAGVEHSGVHTAALPRDEEFGELCSEPPDHSECTSGSKEISSDDNTKEKVS